MREQCTLTHVCVIIHVTLTFRRISLLTSSGIHSAVCTWKRTSAFVLTGTLQNIMWKNDTFNLNRKYIIIRQIHSLNCLEPLFLYTRHTLISCIILISLSQCVQSDKHTVHSYRFHHRVSRWRHEATITAKYERLFLVTDTHRTRSSQQSFNTVYPCWHVGRLVRCSDCMLSSVYLRKDRVSGEKDFSQFSYNNKHIWCRWWTSYQQGCARADHPDNKQWRYVGISNEMSHII